MEAYSLIRIAVVCGAILGFYAFFYRVVVKRWGRFVQPLAERYVHQASHPARHVEAVGKLAAANVAQALFALVLLVFLGIKPDTLLDSIGRTDLILLGALLGIGELVLSSLLCTAVVHLGLLLAADREAGREMAWLVQGSGGWMSQFNATLKTAPAWLTIVSIGGYVAGEELIFRGILLELLREADMIWGVSISTLLFIAIQPFNMPSARAASFPMIGAAVVGLTHGIIYWQVPILFPLIVAHLTFFAGTLWMASDKGSTLLVY